MSFAMLWQILLLNLSGDSGEAALRFYQHHSLAGNYPLGTLDYTTSPDHYKLILSTCKLLNRQERIWISFNTAYLPYGQMLRTHRELFHQAFEAETSAEYQDFMSSRSTSKCLMMLINLAFYSYAAYIGYSGSLIFTAVYRYEILPGAEGDPLIRRTREAVDITRKVLAPERAVHGVFASDRTLPH
jgi:hypothetical protein